MTAERGAPLALVVLAHPRPGSLNHAIADHVAAVLGGRGYDVEVSDLYEEGFDPVLRAGEADVMTPSTEGAHPDPEVARHQTLLRRAEVLVAVHPNWWGKPPALMAGWIDRVLAPGVAYRLDSADGEPVPLLGLRHLVVLNTSETDPLREATVFGDPLDSIWLRCVGEYVPTASRARRTFGPVSTSTDDDRGAWLRAVEDLLPSAG